MTRQNYQQAFQVCNYHFRQKKMELKIIVQEGTMRTAKPLERKKS